MSLESYVLAQRICFPKCITKQQVQPISDKTNSIFLNCLCAIINAWFIILQLFSFNYLYITSLYLRIFISGYFIIWGGINSETNYDTKYPSWPWSFNKLRILKSFILFIFVFITNESWIIFTEASFPGPIILL